MPDDKLRSLDILRNLIDMASRSPRFWRSFNRIVVPARAFENLLENLVEEVPIDIRKAQEMLDERDRLMDEAVARSEKIVDEAASEAQKLLDESEIMRKAKRMAQTMREEADRYVLETLENVEDMVAGILTKLKKAQTDLVSGMELRRREAARSKDASAPE